MNPPRQVRLDTLENIGNRFDALETKRAIDNEMLTRIDERTRRMASDIEALKGEYLRKDEFYAKFNPVQNYVFGIIALISVTVGTAVIALALNKI